MEKLIKSTTSLLSLSSSRKISIKHYKSIISILFIISLILIILTTTITVKYDLEKFTPFTTTISTTSNKPFKPFKPSSPKQQDKLQQEIDQHQLDNNNNNKGNKKKDKRIIIFPNNFPLIKDDQLVKYYTEFMNQALNPQDLIYRNRFDYKIPQFSYSTQQFELFSNDINNNNDDDNDDDIIKKHWYQFIGSTVWLQQYGVHLMISRIIYTEKDQGLPIISLAYLQLFDRNWNELNDVELIIPDPKSNPKPNYNKDNNNNNDKQLKYKSIIYPYFAPIPIYHNIKQLKRNNGRQFYGVEDPRIILIQNEFGYEEPIIIYNSHHRKILNINFDDHDNNNDNNNDQEGKINFKNYRSLFIGWLWQTQIGKFNLEQLSDIDYSKENEYIKIKELTRPNNQRNLIEKNWSLFLNHQEKLIDGYHSFIYFIYQFKNLKILKCPITTTTTTTTTTNNKENDNDNDNDNGCQWEYQIHDDNKFDSGYLHGGTELININEILENYLLTSSTTSSSSSSSSTFGNGKQLINSIKDKLPSNRQLWIGFARAAMKNCGCGEKMYRPNMVILIKDTTTSTTNSALGFGFGFGESKYKLTHVSSFMDLGIEILPWWEDQGLCKGNNVVIPNGISSWTIENEIENENEIESKSKLKSKVKVNNLMDYLILTITRRDATIDLVYIKGLLNALLSLNPNHNNNNNQINGGDGIGKSSIFKSSIFFHGNLINDDDDDSNINKNIDCALQYSHKYCQIYGETLKIEDEFQNKEKQKDKDKGSE